MQILSNLIDKFLQDDPSFFRHSWLITRVGNAEMFIEFVLLEAPEGSIWFLSQDSVIEVFNNLSKYDLDGYEIEITEDNRKKLINLLPDLNIKENVIAHSIRLPDGSTFFKSYDNLTCIWLSKDIHEEIMESLAKRYDFDYLDYNDGNRSKI